MVAKDVMTSSVVTAMPDTPVPELARLLLDRRISAVPVVDSDRRILGIVSEGDLMRRPESGTERRPGWWLELFGGAEGLASEYIKAHGVRAADIMTRKVVTITEDASLGEIAQLLEERRVKRVPVVRGGKLVGIVSRADLLRGLATRHAQSEVPLSADDRVIREKFLQVLERERWARPAYVNVIVANGTVHLWGTVDSGQERRALLIAAGTIPGVRGVEDHLVEFARYLRGA